MKHKIINVDEKSIAYKKGIRDGQVLVSVNGEPVLDFVDYKYLISTPIIALKVQDDDLEIEVTLKADDYSAFGFEVADTIYPPDRQCNNNCIFCFVDQLPKGVRENLYIKDDDWRYSLLFGNYVTLTNVNDSEFERIINRKASPLYISVHATDEDVRNRLLGRKHTEIMSKLKRLADNEIVFHSQIVLCPGINDGDVLQQTMEDLFSLYPYSQSLAVVPVGLTKHREGLPEIKPVDKTSARDIIAKIENFSKITMESVGKTFVYASDEVYQRAEMEYPLYKTDEFEPQIANGVGMISETLSEFNDALEELPGFVFPRKVTIVTGVSAFDTMQDISAKVMSKVRGARIDVVRANNTFFGESVTVSGLLTTEDILTALGDGFRGNIILPPRCVRSDNMFLDDKNVSDLEKIIKGSVTISPENGYDLAFALIGKHK